MEPGAGTERVLRPGGGRHVSPLCLFPPPVRAFRTELDCRNANADEVRDCQRCKMHFSTTFEMPEFWWSQSTRRSNGYFGCDSRRDEDGVMIGYSEFSPPFLTSGYSVRVNTDAEKDSWCRFLVKMLDTKDYVWAKFNIFTQWRAQTRQTAILVFDLHRKYNDIQLSFQRPAFYGPGRHQGGGAGTESHSPLWPYTRVLGEVSNLQDTSVWAIRTLIRDVEKSAGRDPEDRKEKPKIDYPALHDLARHAIHACETLDVSVRTARAILEHHARFVDELGPSRTPPTATDEERRQRCVSAGAARNVHEKLQHMEHMLESLRHRSSSNKARLLNEIQLCYHMSSDYDSTISVQIASATRADSADMRTVAYLTLTFLPATFISALFGTSFFSFEQDTGTWAVSDRFWIFWAIAVPATLATIAVWYVWKNWAPAPAPSRKGTGLSMSSGSSAHGYDEDGRGWRIRLRELTNTFHDNRRRTEEV